MLFVLTFFFDRIHSDIKTRLCVGSGKDDSTDLVLDTNLKIKGHTISRCRVKSIYNYMYLFPRS